MVNGVKGMNHYTGSDFDDFLAEEGLLEEVTARAQKRLLALQLQDAMEASHLTKTELAERMETRSSTTMFWLRRSSAGCSITLWRLKDHFVGRY